MDKMIKYHYKNAEEAREIDFLSPMMGTRNVCMKCGPLNLTHTSTWSLPMDSSLDKHGVVYPRVLTV